MRKALALVRASWKAAMSYRIRSVLSLASLLVSVVPIYYIAKAIQPIAQHAIEKQGGEYFGFVIVGMATMSLIMTSVNALPTVVNSGISTGTLEALLSTPTRVPTLLAGLIGYPFFWAMLQLIVLLTAARILGAHYSWAHALPALGILLLTVLAYLPIGLLAAALVLAFRTAGPLQSGVVTLSTLLGGVYYPTHVIPSWIQSLSAFVPLTYGLRAFRQTLLEGMPLSAVASDVGILMLFVAGLTLLGTYAFTLSLRYARRAGTLAQY